MPTDDVLEGRLYRYDGDPTDEQRTFTVDCLEYDAEALVSRNLGNVTIHLTQNFNGGGRRAGSVFRLTLDFVQGNFSEVQPQL